MTTPLRTLFRIELAKTVRRPVTWVVSVILLGVMALVYVSLAVTLLTGAEGNISIEGGSGSLRDQILLPDGLGLGISLVQLIGGILLIILAAGIFGSEFSWGTLRTMLLMRADRLRLVAAKLLVLALAAVSLAAVGLVVSFVGSLGVGLVLSEGTRTGAWLHAGFFGHAATVALRSLVGIAFWTLFAAAITVLTRSVAAGIGISMAIVLVADSIIGLIARLGTVGLWISRVFPNTAINALTALNGNDPPRYAASDWAWIAANLAGYVVILAVVTLVRVRRMNMLTTS